jgi:hypothetical protein
MNNHLALAPSTRIARDCGFLDACLGHLNICSSKNQFQSSMWRFVLGLSRSHSLSVLILSRDLTSPRDFSHLAVGLKFNGARYPSGCPLRIRTQTLSRTAKGRTFDPDAQSRHTPYSYEPTKQISKPAFGPLFVILFTSFLCVFDSLIVRVAHSPGGQFCGAQAPLL